MKDKILGNLNDSQKEAVIVNDCPLAIIAGPGSGKTRTIAHKIAYLLLVEEVKPSKILAVTFTNKASKELKERVEAIAGPIANDVQISTYHSFCAKILRSEISALDFPKNFMIIDSLDQKQILKEAFNEFGLIQKSLSHASVIDYISKMKNMDKSVEDLEIEAKNDKDRTLLKLYKFYLKRTSSMKSLDFDDLIIFTHKIFKENKDVAKKWESFFSHILIDEFQDTSTMQYEIIRFISTHNKITVVGDPDQTIYTWRNADPKLILDFHASFKKSKIIKLEQNYRSTEEILKVANKLIKNNKQRIDKHLFTENGKGNKIRFYYGFSNEDEARWVYKQVRELQMNGSKLKDMAILFRANYLSAPLEKMLIEKNLNYALFGSIKFYQRQEIKDVISFLKILNNGDDLAFRRMINVPSRKLGEIAISKLSNLHSSTGLLLDGIVENFNSLPINKTKIIELANFINLIKKYKAALNSNKISEVISKFLIEVKYYSIWSSLENQTRVENIKELIELIKVWEKDNPKGTLNEYISETSLYLDKSEERYSDDYISLMTVHNSKGLEFKDVFIYGFSEDIFPSRRSLEGESDQEDNLEEERRLAYVAITRAKKNLFISSSRGFARDFQSEKKPSRFLKEAGIVLEEHTSRYIAPKKIEEIYDKDKNLVEGDKITHAKFGEGVVVSVENQLVNIAFKSPHGVKTMMKNHKSIVRVDD